METDDKPKSKPSQFLRTIDPLTVYDAAELAMDYVKEVGLHPCWPIHSAQRAQLDIIAAGGGKKSQPGAWMDNTNPLAPVCYGFEVAEAVASNQAPDFKPLAKEDGKFVDMKAAYEQAVLSLDRHGR